MCLKLSFALGLAVIAGLSSLASAGPGDIYAAGGTPCVAAHSTTRALYNAFTGPLYQVKRDSDGATRDITPISAGGVANAAAQDSFCSATTCLITIIYDQSGRGNHLTQAPPGGYRGPEANGYDNLASATGAPVTLGGRRVYGVFIPPGTGYRNNAASGTAKGDEPQGVYAVIDASHYNEQCCWDYGNAETGGSDTGAGHMEAVYFGTCTIWGYGQGKGPWLMADMEDGLFSGFGPKYNADMPSIAARFYTAIVKGTTNLWALRGADASAGSLTTYYSGVRPNGYTVMHKEGAVILGIGGDNSNGAQGSFFEGCMTSGYPSDATENAVQANIAAARYGTAAMTSGSVLTVGDSVSFRATTEGYNTRYLAHSGSSVNTQVVTSGSPTALKQQASWTVRTGLGNGACFSFESRDTPGSYVRHYDFALTVAARDGSKQFDEDSTFCPQAGIANSGQHSIRSWNYPTRFFRHYNNGGYLASNGGVHNADTQSSFNDDVTWVVSPGLA